MADIVLAIGLILIIEGGLYALFPDAMKTMMHVALAQPKERLRLVGLGTATAGVFLVWLLRRFA